MIQLLIRKFIPDYENVTDSSVRERYGTLSSTVGILCNLLLFAVKFLLGFVSGSIAITADAFNNLSDVGSSVVTLLGFKIASIPADRNHPFGHGRVEYLSGLVISMLILVVGLEFIKTSFGRILHPDAVVFSTAVLIGLLISIAAKLWLYRFNDRLGGAIHSSSLAAAAADSRSDAMATSVTLLSVILSRFTDFPVDGVMGMIVALLIFKAGIEAAKDTINPLLGTAPDPELVQELRNRILSYDGVEGVHDLIVHDYGPGRLFASAHAEVPADVSILESHDVIDNIEREVSQEMNLMLVLHMDPVEYNRPIVAGTRDAMLEKLRELDERYTLHDFRMVQGTTHTNLIFDILVPLECPYSDEELREQTAAKARELDPSYCAVVSVDRDYTGIGTPTR